MRSRRTIFGLALVASALWSSVAFGQQKAAAEALFRSGREAAQRGDWVTACDRFSASNRLDSTPGTILNLAKCREELGQIASAWARYQEAAQKLPAGDRRRTLALQRAEALEARLPRVTFHLDSPPAGTVIENNGDPLEVDALGVPLPVDPGKQKVVVRAPDREPWTVEFEVAEGEQVEKVLALGVEKPKSATGGGSFDSAEAPPPDHASRPQEGDSSARQWGYVAGGVGLVGIGVGTVAGFMTMQAWNEVDDPDNCGPNGCNQDGVTAADRGKVYSAVSTAGFAVGLAGLGIGTYLLFIREDGGVQRGVAVAPTPGGATIQFGGTL
jgi:hypothetical protein